MSLPVIHLNSDRIWRSLTLRLLCVFVNRHPCEVPCESQQNVVPTWPMRLVSPILFFFLLSQFVGHSNLRATRMRTSWPSLMLRSCCIYYEHPPPSLPATLFPELHKELLTGMEPFRIRGLVPPTGYCLCSAYPLDKWSANYTVTESVNNFCFQRFCRSLGS